MKGFSKNKRDRLFPFLKGGIYGDWTGAALPPVSLIEDWSSYLKQNMLGNPHSRHLPSVLAAEEVERTRLAVLNYFNASSSEYEVIFTPNSTAAIRLVAHYSLRNGSLLLLEDNHNSINGLRRSFPYSGAKIGYSPITADLKIDEDALWRNLKSNSAGNKLLAYPAKSNHSGHFHSLNWVKTAQEKGWDVLLDAAAFVSNCPLDLSAVKPEFIPISFYKIFGFPTGIGCLLIKKSVYEKMDKRWFAGGSIRSVSVEGDFFFPEDSGPSLFEDGTVNFGMIPAVRNGLRFMKSLGDTGMFARRIAVNLFDRLSSIGRVVIHSPLGSDIVNFSIKKGNWIIDPRRFEEFANNRDVSVRTGCFCNPGASKRALGYSMNRKGELFHEKMPQTISINDLRNPSADIPIGSIRASFGYASLFSDAKGIAEVVEEFIG